MSRLLEIGVSGLRTLEEVKLEFGKLTVLIGDNGAGKSSLLEALRIISLIPGGRFFEDLHREHAIGSAIRAGAPGLTIHVRFEHEGKEYQYLANIDPIRRKVPFELLGQLGGEVLFERMDSRVVRSSVLELGGFQNIADSGFLLDHLSRYSNFPDIFRVSASLLRGIDNHLPFDVTAVWGKRVRGSSEVSHIREPRLAEPGHRLAVFGDNLVNVYQTLRGDLGLAHWQDTLHLVRLGLGPDIKDVSTSAVGSGYITLAIEFKSIGKVPALQLGDGILSYLAFVALVRLDEGRTLLAFDEPETHLHPELLVRVVTLLEDASDRYPVVLSTHSDRLLDALLEPVASVVVCDLDSKHRTRLHRLDREQYDKWKERYRGVGDIRAESQLNSILKEEWE